ncbi:FHA domain-containing protein [Phormidium sp. CCY1219]|uniref:FHA domain-containing protein n=1 Tax=Phormidium sp. CCY1219 TaxID=2886104 RepID=UPI002D1EA1AE|nr:FHA domain-containing protein [Phormidium sp. CCY1219]MEB3827027.1 FHA domain-containing protein [Phormidium sp. CCY1219]
MSITCSRCGYDTNPADAEFCEACGAELNAAAPPAPEPPTTVSEPQVVPIAPPEPSDPPLETAEAPATPTVASVTTPPPARLVAKQPNAPQVEFALNNVSLVGIFDSDSGPVDIDLESFVGGDTVSRHHAEIYPDGGGWMVKDLGSTNGIFIKPKGGSRFGARITTPTPLNPGDEVAFAKVQFTFQTS